jgi:hypothetical protein
MTDTLKGRLPIIWGFDTTEKLNMYHRKKQGAHHLSVYHSQRW